MYLQCCHKRLLVIVVDDLVDSAGVATFGLFDPARMLISLDRLTPRKQRHEVLMHEYSHAFEHIVGRVDPADDEGRQNRVVAMAAQFADSLEAAAPGGGERAVHELFGDATDDDGILDIPGELLVTVDDEGSEWPTAVSCSYCHSEYSSRHVRNGKPVFDPRTDHYAVWRVLTCHKCERVVRWRQLCMYDGLPLPKTIVPPTSRPLMLANV